jgi:hypothetical protein
MDDLVGRADRAASGGDAAVVADSGGRLLRAAIAAVLVPGNAPELRLMRTWLDSWSGIGLVVVGMAHQGFTVSLGEHGVGRWIAVFFHGRGGQEPLAAEGTAQEATAWRAVQRAAWHTLAGQRGRLVLRGAFYFGLVAQVLGLGVLAAYAVWSYLQCKRNGRPGAPWLGPALLVSGLLISLLRRAYFGLFEVIPVTRAMPVLIIGILLMSVGFGVTVHDWHKRRRREAGAAARDQPLP